MGLIKRIKKKAMVASIKSALIGIGGASAAKSKWIGKLDDIIDVALRFPDYGADVLYGQACAVSGLNRKDWDDLSIKERLGFLAVRALVDAYKDLVEDENAPKPVKSERPKNRPKNSGLDRASADDDENDPRARYSAGKK